MGRSLRVKALLSQGLPLAALSGEEIAAEDVDGAGQARNWIAHRMNDSGSAFLTQRARAPTASTRP